MTCFKTTTLPNVLAAVAISLAAAASMPAGAQATPTILQTSTSPDGLLTLTLASTNPTDTAGVNNTYIWTATNNSMAIALTGVILGSHWGDWCGGGSCYPSGPTLISMGPGCGGQNTTEFPEEIASFGVWCSPATGTTLAPGASISGSVTLRPGNGGPADYGVYSGYNDPVTGKPMFAIPRITQSATVAPAATDVQIKGAASNGAPPAGSTFTYTYQVKNAGPWGTYGGVILVDTLPASLAYVSASATVSAVSAITGQVATVSLPLCNAVGQTVMCALDDLRNGAGLNQATVTITVVASGVPQQIVNTASVHTVFPQIDSNDASNSVTVAVTTK